MRIVFKQPNNLNSATMSNRIQGPTPKTPNSNGFPDGDFFDHVFDSLKDYSIFTLDTNLLITSWNLGAINIFQYTPNEILKSSFEILFTNEDRQSGVPASEIAAAVHGERAIDNRWHIRKDGSKFYAQGQIFPVRSGGGELRGFVMILRDLTENKLTEEAINMYIGDLEELNAHKDNILAILSHDLRSPLARMISISNFLLSDFDTIDPEELKSFLRNINKSARQELNMLDYLMEWARIKYASQVFTPAKIDLFQYVMKGIESVQASTKANQIKLENHVNENTIVFADGKMILSVIQNILTNAIKHSKESGVVEITSYKRGRNVVIMIKDNGIGMSLETQQKLFSPNVESLAHTRKKNKGGGIGMLLTKGFLETNGGKIWVESFEGIGSSFYFSLPVNRPQPKDMIEKRLDFANAIITA